jgi:hypothetical protein
VPTRETFLLISGAIGLVADIAGLATFLWALLSGPSGGQFHASVAPLWVVAVLSLLNLYGWLSISWWLARRFVLSHQRLAQKDSRDSCSRTAITNAVAGVGVLVSPIWVAVWAGWIVGTASESLGPDPAVICMPPLMLLFFMGVVIWFALAFLMPLVYTDMEHMAMW